MNRSGQNIPTRLERIRAEKARRSYWEFVKEVFRQDLAASGRELVENWHLKELCDDIQDRVERLMNGLPVKGAIVNIPPGSLKSTIYGKCLFPWAILHDPTFSQMGLAYEAGLATRDAVHARRIIESDWYRRNFCSDSFEERFGFRPELAKDQNQKTEFETTKGGKRYAAGIAGRITGEHFHLITIDDANSPKKAESEADREFVHAILDGTIPTRFKSKTSRCLINIQQRVHEMDASGYLMTKDPDQELYDQLIIPAILSDNVTERFAEFYVDELFFPDEFPKDYLEQMEKEMGPTKFASQFLQKVAPAEGNMIKGWMFGWYDPEEIDPKTTVNFDVDTAFGEEDVKRKKNGKLAYSVILAHTKTKWKDTEFLDLLGVSRNRLISPKWRRHLVMWTAEHGYSNKSKIRIEPKANGKQQIQEIRQGIRIKTKSYTLNVLPDKTKDGSKEVMVENALVKLETGQVRLPGSEYPKTCVMKVGGQVITVPLTTPITITREDKSKFKMFTVPWVAVFLHECMAFPKTEFKDQVDCLTQAIRNELRTRVFKRF